MFLTGISLGGCLTLETMLRNVRPASFMHLGARPVDLLLRQSAAAHATVCFLRPAV